MKPIKKVKEREETGNNIFLTLFVSVILGILQVISTESFQVNWTMNFISQGIQGPTELKQLTVFSITILVPCVSLPIIVINLHSSLFLTPFFLIIFSLHKVFPESDLACAIPVQATLISHLAEWSDRFLILNFFPRFAHSIYSDWSSPSIQPRKSLLLCRAPDFSNLKWLLPHKTFRPLLHYLFHFCFAPNYLGPLIRW